MTTGKQTKRYETPNHPFQGERISEEAGLVDRYGLASKEELWRAQSRLRDFRREARSLLGTAQGDVDLAGEMGADFIGRLKNIGILDEGDDISDVLSLSVTDVLERRFQTVAYRKGLGSTPKQARQFIVHGHVTVDGARVTAPSKFVTVDEEDHIAFDDRSPLEDELHPARAEGQE